MLLLEKAPIFNENPPIVEFAIHEGQCLFFFALGFHRGWGIPKSARTVCPILALWHFLQSSLPMAVTYGSPTSMSPRPLSGRSWGRLVPGLSRWRHVRGQLGIGGRWLPSAMAASGRVCAPHAKMVSVCHALRGRSRRGGGGPNGVSIEQCAQCLLPQGTTTGHFCLGGEGGGRWCPSHHRGGGGGGGRQATPTSAPWPRCAMGRHCRGLACKSTFGLRCRRAPFWW